VGQPINRPVKRPTAPAPRSRAKPPAAVVVSAPGVEFVVVIVALKPGPRAAAAAADANAGGGASAGQDEGALGPSFWTRELPASRMYRLAAQSLATPFGPSYRPLPAPVEPNGT